MFDFFVLRINGDDSLCFKPTYDMTMSYLVNGK